jgi:dynein heavy chain, axonemal
MLDTSKVTSDTINQRMKQSEVTRKEIDAARESYRVVAKRGSVIYFVIASLANIDPMYQYSLEFFIILFKKRLEKSENPPVIEQRLKILIDDITESFYKNICRGLFEKDKLLFSFMLASNIELGAGKIDAKLWNFFLRGYSGDVIEDEKPYPEFPDIAWRNVLGLSTISGTYRNLTQSMKDAQDGAVWKKVMETPDPLDVELPLLFRSITLFQKLLLIKTLREERLVSLIIFYVKNTLGAQFIESPLFDLKGPFADSLSTTPLIFILSPGADPISYLTDLAKEKDMEQRLKMLSLGQGQVNYIG